MKNVLINTAAIVALFVVACVVLHFVHKTTCKQPAIINVDTFEIKKDSLKTEIKKIDNEKDKRIKEVLQLDNDSTIKLFKRLVSE